MLIVVVRWNRDRARRQVHDDIAAPTANAGDRKRHRGIDHEDRGRGVTAVHLEEVTGGDPISGGDVHIAFLASVDGHHVCRSAAGRAQDGRDDRDGGEGNASGHTQPSLLVASACRCHDAAEQRGLSAIG